MVKKAASTITLSLLLIGCGSQQTPISGVKPTSPSTPASAFNGLDVAGQPNMVKHHITIPPEETLPIQLKSTLQSQSLLPAWTGPRQFVSGIDNNNYNSWTFDANSNGELFAQEYKSIMNKDQPLELSKYSSTGQLLASQKSYNDGSGNGLRFPTGGARHWLAVTEDGPQEEAYQIFDSYAGVYYDNTPADVSPYKFLAEIYSSSLVPLPATNDPLFPLFSNESIRSKYQDRITVKSGKKGFVFSGANDKNVLISEFSHQTWNEVDGLYQTQFLAPAELPNTQLESVVDVASDGSIYSAIFAPYLPNCVNYRCPAYAVLTKFINGQIEWQDYWEMGDSVSLMDIAANKDGVSLLVNKVNPNGPYEQSNLLNFSSNGAALSNARIPIEELRSSLTYLPEYLRYNYAPELTGLKTDDTGEILAFNKNNILAGNLKDGFLHSFLKDDGRAHPNNSDPVAFIQDIVFKSGYIYAHEPAYNSVKNDTIIPLDRNLQPR
ncbi:hypothetical protein [Deinococcus altitudinis]|uniref:hypothetical protein n=1 Tax=Deinococcus altitudinis TaxID=468914 RepID=UPI0038912EF1